MREGPAAAGGSGASKVGPPRQRGEDRERAGAAPRSRRDPFETSTGEAMMLRPLLLGTAMMLAVPSLAQTTPPGADVGKPGMTGTGQDATSAGQYGAATMGVGNPDMGTTATAQTDARARCAPATRHMSRAAARARAASCGATGSMTASAGDSGWGLGANA